ncbi:MAG: DNA polymerase domain-containing protein [Candidatus Bathyarchaeia archaeon]
MTVYYLLGAEVVPDGLKLLFFNQQTSNLEEMLDEDYRPYFFVPHPLSKADEKIVDEFGLNTEAVEKKELFSDQLVKVTKVELRGYSDPKETSEKFENAWEGEVPYVLGYMYDHGLVFGAQHVVHGDKVHPILEMSEDIKVRFDSKFSHTREVDPSKYELLKRLSALCSQPIPEIPPGMLGIDGKINREQYYLAFILSRVGNLPVPQTYSDREVSTWKAVRSILHDYYRRSNILIPTSEELRRGEKKRRIKGALTFPPEPGIHFNTVVTDFESLYPSLIDVRNLSHETIDCPHIDCHRNKVPGLEHHVCQRRRGIYSVLIGSIRDLRIRWFKPLAGNPSVSPERRRLAQATSQLLKFMLVLSYGVTVRMHGLARPSLGECITAYGRHSLQTTLDMAKACGLHSVYGDTDSLFFADPLEKQLEWLIKAVKERLRLDLAVDVRYSICVLPKAMKAYFGIRTDGTPDIKGLTAIKSNSPIYIQKVFRNCVQEMADVKNNADYEDAKGRIKKVVRNAIEELMTGKVSPKDLEYQVRIHEDPMEKIGEKTLHQPYQCAVQQIDSGRTVNKGDTVRFVKVTPFLYKGRTFTVKPTESVKGFTQINVQDYIRNLRTSLNQTLKPMNISFVEEEKNTVMTDFL